MKRLSLVLAGLCLAVGASSAGRVEPADLGLSVWVPPHWVLNSEGGDAAFRFFSLYDTTGAHAGFVTFEVYSGANLLGGDRKWVDEEALVRGLMIEGSCFGSLVSDDSMLVDGAYAREIYGRAAECDSGSLVLLSNMKDYYHRVTGNGDIGWVLSFESDTADADTAASTYFGILDSVRLDRSFLTIPNVGVKRRYLSPTVREVVSAGSAIRIATGAGTVPEVEVMDLSGRRLAGRLEPKAGGLFLWTAQEGFAGTVAVRVRSGGLDWTGRAVLSR